MTNHGMTPLYGRDQPAAATQRETTHDPALLARAVIAAGKARRSEPLDADDIAALAAVSDEPVEHREDRPLTDAERAAAAAAILKAGRIRRGEEPRMSEYSELRELR